MKRGIEITLLCVYISIILIIFGWFKLIKKNNGIIQIKDMVETPSKWESLNNSPCKFQIVGEPGDSGKFYAKISIKCKNGKSENTVSLKPLSRLTFENLINMVSLVNKFDKELFLGENKKWKCWLNGVELNYNDVIYPTNSINCEEI